MKTARKYLSLTAAIFRVSAVADLEYRMNIVVKIFTDILWYATQLSVFEILFRHAPNLAGWTIDSTRVFMGLLFISDGFGMLLFSENLDRLSDRVRKGELDLLLVKPVNSQFMISCQKMAVPFLGNIILASGWLAFALHNYPSPIHWWRMALLVILIPTSVAITYSIKFVFSAFALILTRADNIAYVWYQIYRLGTRPDSIYPNWLRYCVLTFVPVAFLASVPARVVLFGETSWWLVGAVAMATVLVWLSSKFWRYALRSYASASS